MKIVGWEELKTLPKGTIYQLYYLHSVGNAVVLGEVRSHETVVAELLPDAMLGCNYNSEDRKRLGIGENDFIVQTPSYYGKCDFYGDKDSYRFLVWEDGDKRRLARWLTMDPSAMADEMEDKHPKILAVDEAHQIAPAY